MDIGRHGQRLRCSPWDDILHILGLSQQNHCGIACFPGDGTTFWFLILVYLAGLLKMLLINFHEMFGGDSSVDGVLSQYPDQNPEMTSNC